MLVDGHCSYILISPKYLTKFSRCPCGPDEKRGLIDNVVIWISSEWEIGESFKKIRIAVAGMPHWIESQPASQRVACSVPD